MRIEGLGSLQQPDPKNKKSEGSLPQDKTAHKHRLCPDKIEVGKDNVSSTEIGYTSKIKKEQLPAQDTLNDYSKIKRLSNYSREILFKAHDVRHEKIAEIKKKIAEGFYDRPDNFGLIADGIIDYYFDF
jgi:anti-sigma28 factor (negative regulator of flagellin synthesis)